MPNQIHKSKSRTVICQGLGEEILGSGHLKDTEVPFRKMKRALEMGGTYGCTIRCATRCH